MMDNYCFTPRAQEGKKGKKKQENKNQLSLSLFFFELIPFFLSSLSLSPLR